MRTLKEMIAELPAKEQRAVKARTKQLIAEEMTLQEPETDADTDGEEDGRGADAGFAAGEAEGPAREYAAARGEGHGRGFATRGDCARAEAGGNFGIGCGGISAETGEYVCCPPVSPCFVQNLIANGLAKTGR